ncbi:MAG TPA: YegP family protein [Pseudolysinimonas sp.]|nr:YegP family protein [Pseudolysinimonas sp.]
MAAKFEIKTTTNGQFHWVLKAANGEPIAQSETYTTKSAAQNGIDSVKSNAAGAEVVDLT